MAFLLSPTKKEPAKKATSFSAMSVARSLPMRSFYCSSSTPCKTFCRERGALLSPRTLKEVTETLRVLPVETAIERVNLKYGGATDYARAFEDFADLAMADINRVTTVIVLGDETTTPIRD